MTDVFVLEEEKADYQLLPLKDKIERSIEIIRLASKMSWEFYNKPFICCYSGGKDSDVLLHLCEKALPLSVFEVMNSHTTVDAPETVYHIREVVDGINTRGGQCNNKLSSRQGRKFYFHVGPDPKEKDATNKSSEILLLCSQGGKHTEPHGCSRGEERRECETAKQRRFLREGGVITDSYIFFA